MSLFAFSQEVTCKFKINVIFLKGLDRIFPFKKKKKSTKTSRVLYSEQFLTIHKFPCSHIVKILALSLFHLNFKIF